MKAKGLCAFAFAAGIGISIAQSNVVTNVSITLKGGINFNLICNPLNNTNNDTTNLFRFGSDGDQIYRWNPVIQDLDGVGGNYPTYSTVLGWSSHFILKPGEAVFYLNTGGNRILQFNGEVVQTPYTNPVPFGTIAVRGDVAFNAFGSISPVATSITNALIGLTPADGDQVFFWDTSIQDWSPTIPTYSVVSHTWDPSTPVLRPGIGFFYMRAGPNQTQWVRNYTVQ
jgi:hypothetical protein